MTKRSKGDSKGGKKKFKFNGIVEPATSGIYATCNKGREQNARKELLNLFQEKVEEYYDLESVGDLDDANDEELSVEDQIKKELKELQDSKDSKSGLLQPIELGCECVVFIKTKRPINPEEFVEKICQEAHESKIKSTRYTQRLSPIQFSCSPTIEEIKKLSLKVLKPHFHKDSEQKPHTFAIQVNRRNFNQIPKGDIINAVAETVGRNHGHKVDLKNFEKLIIVECFKSNVGMSVVNNYEKYQKFNLQQIYEKAIQSDENEGEDLSRVKGVVAKEAAHQKPKEDVEQVEISEEVKGAKQQDTQDET